MPVLGGACVELNDILKIALKGDASDIHLKPGLPPMFRVDGALVPLKNGERLTPEDLTKMAFEIMNPVQKQAFEDTREVDLAYGIPGLGRFRVNAFQQRGTVGIVFRVIPFGVKSIDHLHLPKIIERIAMEQRGLVLVTGTTGSGKSTTLAGMIDYINSNRTCHIMTIEDPIEFLIRDRRSIVNQREVGVDTPNMAEAIRGAMRHDTDVIMVSELSDPETARVAIDAAETGHLVISSMRTTDPAETVSRLVSMFPDSQKAVIRSQLAAQLQAIISQLLIETSESGVTLACEVLTNNERPQEWIMSGEESSFLVEVIKESGFHGMQTFDQALLKHIVDHTVEIDTALPHERNSHEMKAKALAAGISV